MEPVECRMSEQAACILDRGDKLTGVDGMLGMQGERVDQGIQSEWEILVLLLGAPRDTLSRWGPTSQRRPGRWSLWWSRVLPRAARTRRVLWPAFRVSRGTEERQPVQKHRRCIRAPSSSPNAWELQRSSGERCAAPGCDWRGTGGEARLVPGGPPDTPGAIADTTCRAGASKDWCGPTERRAVLPCAWLKRHWKCGLDRIHILSSGGAAVEDGPWQERKQGARRA
ncbi:hypothetical protein NDU88_001895 [Pleurodeles waltl]|uniref:Uncharacterized protein n=1 Tax=Pleurodeles waltl TaxID=8319 RepID=A0AAV7TKA4_PLEWA|nr:hypothetical protein NDU88_001895 [Pleurodeles waltl]